MKCILWIQMFFWMPYAFDHTHRVSFGIYRRIHRPSEIPASYRSLFSRGRVFNGISEFTYIQNNTIGGKCLAQHRFICLQFPEFVTRAVNNNICGVLIYLQHLINVKLDLYMPPSHTLFRFQSVPLSIFIPPREKHRGCAGNFALGGGDSRWALVFD